MINDKFYKQTNGLTGGKSSMPPLPEPLSVQAEGGAGFDMKQSLMEDGCYYIRLIPHSFDPPARYHYEGTLRFRMNRGTIIASGDLYTRDFCDGSVYCPSVSGELNQENHIPVFPRNNYAYYLRVVNISSKAEDAGSIDIKFEAYHFDHEHRGWEYSDSLLKATLSLRTGIDGIRSWCGAVETESGVVMGHLSAVRISRFLRQAEVEIDCVKDCELPLKNSRDEDWSHIFAKAGWDVSFKVSNTDVKNPGDLRWSTAELHKIMIENRDKVDLDKRWRFHMLAVPQFDDYDAFGVMYDHTSRDINDIPREGAAIAANIFFEDSDIWGKCKARRFGETGDPYFRTAIHEIGHAMMLRHPDNSHENSIMQCTVSIAYNAGEGKEFPDNIQWAFSPGDVHLLCHLPDIAVRPGGLSFGSPSQRVPVNARYETIRPTGIQLNVTTLCNVVPMGATVRVEFELCNTSKTDKKIPGSLSMKSGHISGKIIDPSGMAQEFATIMHYTRETAFQVLKPGETRKHSVTLIWGTDGPLFPQPGYYRIVLDFSWFRDGIKVLVGGGTGVLVSAPENREHAEAAYRVLSSSDTLLALAIGGDHRSEGSEAIRNAVADPALKQHYALVEAKRIGQRFHGRPPSLEDAAAVLDDDTLMTRAEIKRIAKIIHDTIGQLTPSEIDKTTVAHLHAVITKKADRAGLHTEIEEMLNRLQQFT